MCLAYGTDSDGGVPDYNTSGGTCGGSMCRISENRLIDL